EGPVRRAQAPPLPAPLSRLHPAAGAPPAQHEPVRAAQPRDRRVVRDDLRLGAGVLRDPPLAVGPLAPVVDDVDAHGTPVATQSEKDFPEGAAIPTRSSPEACSTRRTRRG